MKVGVIGAGRVGLASGFVLCELGHDVTLFDLDAARVERLRAGTMPFFEVDAAAALQAAARSGRWTVTDRADALADCAAVLIAVPTPAGSDGQYDLAAIHAAVDTLIAVRARAGGRCRWRGVFLRSTVLPGTTQRLLGTALADPSITEGPPCPVGYLPEFFREGSVLADARRPDRIVVGADDPGLRALARALFDGLETTWLETAIGAAELVKAANNALLSSCVSFANEIARLAATIEGVDVAEVFAGLHLDRRLRGTGIAQYLLPGPGFGGSCLPKDLAALAAFADTRGEGGSMLDAALRINRTQPAWIVERIAQALGGLPGRGVLVLGLAFKPGTDDLRESIALPLCRELAARGAAVRAHDPQAEPGAALALLASAGAAGVSLVTDATLHDACDAAEAIVLVTAWPVYLEMLPALLGRRSAPLLFADPRGILRGVKRAARVSYLGVGARPTRDG